MARVIGVGRMLPLTSRTISAFCAGDTRQPMTAVQSQTTERKMRRIDLSAEQNMSAAPSMTSASGRFRRRAFCRCRHICTSE